MVDPSDAKDFKLWPAPVEKYFIDVLVEEEAKGNMPSGQFKKNLWTVIQDKFNRKTEKHYRKQQLTQKFQQLKQKYRMFAQVIGQIEMG